MLLSLQSKDAQLTNHNIYYQLLPAQDASYSQECAGHPTKSLSSSLSDWPYQDNTDSIKRAFHQSVGEDGLLGLEQLSKLFQELGLQAPSDVVLGLVEATASTQWALTLDET